MVSSRQLHRCYKSALGGRRSLVCSRVRRLNGYGQRQRAFYRRKVFCRHRHHCHIYAQVYRRGRSLCLLVCVKMIFFRLTGRCCSVSLGGLHPMIGLILMLRLCLGRKMLAFLSFLLWRTCRMAWWTCRRDCSLVF